MMDEDKELDRRVGILSMALAPFGALLILLWLAIMYSIALRVFPDAFGIDWPDPLALIPPSWQRVLLLPPRA